MDELRFTTQAAATATEEQRQSQLMWLSERLSERRYQHSLGSEETAVDLAQKFQLKPSQIDAVATAARLHDCAKCMPLNELLDYALEHGIELSDADKKCPQSLHAIIGAHMVETTFGITNPDILDAIRWHTTGRAKMGLVEKLVYIADKIEPYLRDAHYAKQVTQVLDARRLDSLDDAVLVIMDTTVRYLLEREQWIHPATYEARNQFVQRVSRCVTPPRARTTLTAAR